MGTSRLIPTGAVVLTASVALLAGCGGSEATVADDQPATTEVSAAVAATTEGDPAGGDETGGTDGGGEGTESSSALAMTDESEVAGSAMGELDESLARIQDCLVDNGVEDADLTLPTLLSKAQGEFPVESELIDVFGFFLDKDPNDPVFAAAVDACEELVYDTPALAAFLPPPPMG